MQKRGIQGGTAHELPPDFRKALISNPKALAVWKDITPLARNEWICWVESVKKKETRNKHLKRAVSELVEGKRRPCCWMGCVHRTDKPLSPSVKGILLKKNVNNR